MNSPTVKPELRDAILSLAARPDIRSISCALVDFQLWKGFFKEQLARSDGLGLALQEALCLMGPDTGIPGVTAVFNGWEDEDCLPPVFPDQDGNLAPDCWGGEVHIPYEGVCGGDLFIPPHRWGLSPRALSRSGSKLHRIANKSCNFLLLDHDLGEIPHSVRTELVEGWWLYQSTLPFLDCNPFHDNVSD